MSMVKEDTTSSGGPLRIAFAAVCGLLILGLAGTAIYQSRDLFLNSAPLWKWGMLFGGLFFAVAVDIIANRNEKEITVRRAIAFSVIWIAYALLMGLFFSLTGNLPAPETFSLFLTGWSLEMTLSLDNLFVIALIFGSFGLMSPEKQPLQLRILYFGILGMVIMRVLFLSFGAYFIHLPSIHLYGLHIEWPMLIFAAIIGWSVLKMGGDDDEEEVDYSNHWSVVGTRKVFPINPSVESGHFFTSKGVTPLFLCLVCIEFVDFMFAFDSMPVIIAVVKDPFLMAASNLLACAGLRSLYFVLLAAKNKLWALDTAVKYLLIFIACKLAVAAFGYDLPPLYSLGVVITIILGGVAWSLYFPNPDQGKEENSAAA